MNHHHKDMVILLNLNVVNITIKVIIKGWTCVLHLLISLIHVLVRGFILVYLLKPEWGKAQSTCINL
jgi:hypothetical protein